MKPNSVINSIANSANSKRIVRKGMPLVLGLGLLFATVGNVSAQDQSDKRKQEQLEQMRWFDRIQRENTELNTKLARERELKALADQTAQRAEQQRRAQQQQQAANELIRQNNRALEIANQRTQEAAARAERARQEQARIQQQQARADEMRRLQQDQLRRDQENARRYRR